VDEVPTRRVTWVPPLARAEPSGEEGSRLEARETADGEGARPAGVVAAEVADTTGAAPATADALTTPAAAGEPHTSQ
jgi:hypothetical protein